MIENEVLRTMKSRFSCRRFKPDPVEKEKLEAILDAAKYAANGHNLEAWHFTVICSEEGKRELLEAVAPEPAEFRKLAPKGAKWPYPSDFYGAPVVILVSYDPKAPWPEAGAFLAAGNIMNAAQSLGLSTCALTVFSKDVFRTEETARNKAKFIPEGYELYLSMVIGYPAGIPAKKAPRRENVETWL
ncbi:MAG: nitroreductase family protein [Oscillospiraceae bacterium]|nr:nitroreductase family protein [Oscillospiraceae bacterium]